MRQTIKVFKAGADWRGGGELIALSSLPGATQAAMAGIGNHGLGYGCAMLGTTTGDELRRPARRRLPARGAQPVAVDRRSAGGTLGCIYTVDITFKPGRHYYWHHGLIEELPRAGPPQALVDGFALPELGVDITTKGSCKL